MIARLRRMRVPLFLRLFAVMLACVATVQIVNITLIVAIGLPLPQLYPVDRVAAALASGTDPNGNFEFTASNDAPQQTLYRDQPPRLALARRLGVEPTRVEVFRYIPLGSNLPTPLNALRPTDDPAEAFADEVLFGDFTATLRLPDGRWRTITPAHSDAAHWGWRWLLVLLAVAVVVIPFAWAMSHRLARPIAMFAAAADRLGRNFRAAPIEPIGPPEIADAAVAFNRMQGRLERFVEDRSLLIAAIAHDMRTPLMRLSLRLSAAPDALRIAAERDIADMDAMIVAATAFIRDVREPALRRSLDLRTLIESVTDDLADDGGAVSFAAGEALVIEGEASGLKALVSNLVTNALKYAGGAEVPLHRDDQHAVIAVRDHGAGIAPDDLDRVFEPFFRGEPSRNRDTGGIGLGLASVRAVAQAHGGDATIANHPDGGAIARVTLPL